MSPLTGPSAGWAPEARAAWLVYPVATSSPNAPSAAVANLIFMAVMPVYSPPETGYPGHNISGPMRRRTVFAKINPSVLSSAVQPARSTNTSRCRKCFDALYPDASVPKGGWQ